MYCGIASKDTSANLSVTKFGNFTANFEKLPPPIPPEYWIPLYGVIISSIVGWSIPSIIGWIKTFNQRRRLRQYQKEIDSLYSDNKLDKQDIEKLDEMKYKIKIAYAKGKITEQQYEDLKKEISVSYEEVYKEIIASLKETSIDGDSVQLDKFRDNISYAYAKGKITEQHYNNLKNEISLIYEEIYNKRIIPLDGKFDYSTSNNRILLNGIKDDITDAYAKGKITEQHYNLLNNKISDYKNNYRTTNKLSSSVQNLASTSTNDDVNQQ